jgi:hypothetical protein
MVEVPEDVGADDSVERAVDEGSDLPQDGGCRAGDDAHPVRQGRIVDDAREENRSHGRGRLDGDDARAGDLRQPARADPGPGTKIEDRCSGVERAERPGKGRDEPVPGLVHEQVVELPDGGVGVGRARGCRGHPLMIRVLICRRRRRGTRSGRRRGSR